MQTGPPATTGNTSVTTVVTFGPAVIAVGDNQSEDLIVLAGQEDININTSNEYGIPRNAVTTKTDLNTKSYQITGVSVP